MHSHEITLDVAAPVHDIWVATCDIESWPTWSPTMDAVRRDDDGPIRVGSTAMVNQPKLRAATWTVDDVQPDRTFVWHTGGRGYRLTAYHELAPHNGVTRVTLRVTVSGPLSPVVWLAAGRTVKRYLAQEGAALKEALEEQ